MDEKDVNSIASAVTSALSKLNADTKEKEGTQNSDLKPETFKCPDCDALVKGGISYCQSCGCPLEWGD